MKFTNINFNNSRDAQKLAGRQQDEGARFE